MFSRHSTCIILENVWREHNVFMSYALCRTLTCKVVQHFVVHFVRLWVNDCYLTPNEQFSAISWREQVTFDELIMIPALYWTNRVLSGKATNNNFRVYLVWINQASNPLEASTLAITLSMRLCTVAVYSILIGII
jgi:hypothetical protein